MKFLKRMQMIRVQRIGIILLTLLVVGIQSYLYFEKKKSVEVSSISLSESILFSGSLEKKQKEYSFPLTDKKRPVLSGKFNANALNQKQWMELGFSEKQAATILKFKSIKGGNFSSIADLEECFVISEEKLEQLKPYVYFQKTQTSSTKKKFPYVAFQKNTKKYTLKPFNPNFYTQEQWMKLGFSEKQAATILKYKKLVGGKFTSTEQLKRCFVISEEKFQELYPYLLIEKQTEENSLKPIFSKTPTERPELNTATFKDFQKYALPDEIKAKILSFRKGLGGFVLKEQLYEVYGIEQEIAKEIIHDFTLNPENVTKINLNTCEEYELKKHLYLRKYAQKILDIRSKTPITKDNLKQFLTNPSEYNKILLYLTW